MTSLILITPNAAFIHLIEECLSPLGYTIIPYTRVADIQDYMLSTDPALLIDYDSYQDSPLSLENFSLKKNVLVIATTSSETPKDLKTLTRPFSRQDLVAALNSVNEGEETASYISMGNYFLSKGGQVIYNHSKEIICRLTEKETRILEALLQAGPQGVYKQDLMQRIWGHQVILDTHTLESHIYRLRLKLQEIPFQEEGHQSALHIHSQSPGRYWLEVSASDCLAP